MKKKWLAVIGVVILVSIFATAALASNPIKLIVNGREIKPDVAPQIINSRTMIPIRWVAEALGADVQWDEHANAVRINSSQCPIYKPLSKEQIETIIQAQGKHKDSYYFDGLSYDFVNMDDDADWEIVAKIDGAVHLGNFFIFDKDSSGDYKLITEQEWKVEEWDFRNPIEIDGNKLFKLVTRTGGTGLDIFNAHLVYLKESNFLEAWQGTLFERSVMLSGAYYKKVGSYQFDAEGKRLYAWETTWQLERDGVTPKGEFKTTATVYSFNGQKFIIDKVTTKEKTTDEIPYLGMLYVEPEYQVRFVENELDLLFLPYDNARVQRKIMPNTLVQVNDLVIVEDECWLYVTVPVYDTPMNMKGWIKESDTVPFTKDKERKVQSDVTIKAGTLIYEVRDFADISEDLAQELLSDTRGRLIEKREGYAKISAPGGREFWLEEEYIIFPRAQQ